MLYEPLPVDLPQPTEVINDQPIVTVGVTADDKYVIDDEEYSFDELTPILDLKFDSTAMDRKIKIEGDKMAHYEAIFNLISYAKEEDLNPILVYRE